MVKPPKGGFKMSIDSKCPPLEFKGRKNNLIILTSTVIILGALLFLGGKIQEILANKNSQLLNPAEIPELVIFQENTLFSLSNPNDPEPKVVKKLKVVITAYSSTPGQTDDSPYITASGTWVRDGIIANNLLPMGTKIRIPELYGDKIFVVEDRMNSKKGYYHFDIWFSSYWEAKNFGAKRSYIEVLEN
jgi:3D (Asp-Asp-Asp) domain-containing protein